MSTRLKTRTKSIPVKIFCYRKKREYGIMGVSEKSVPACPAGGSYASATVRVCAGCYL